MTQNNEKEQKKLSKRNIATFVFFMTGLILTLGAAGNSDCRDEMEYENRRLEYKKYNVDEEISPKATKTAFCGGMACLAIAGGLMLTKKRQR